MNLRTVLTVCVSVIGFCAVSVAMLGEGKLKNDNGAGDLLAVKPWPDKGVSKNSGEGPDEVLLAESLQYGSSSKIEVPEVTAAVVAIGSDHEQFIGQWLDPDSESSDNMPASDQLIGAPVILDDSFEETSVSVIMTEENPDAVLEVPVSPSQFIGQALSVDELELVDMEATQMIGEVEEVPTAQ